MIDPSCRKDIGRRAFSKAWQNPWMMLPQEQKKNL
jgi:hypothetical protein